MRSNIYELYDLRKDPREKRNIASRNRKALDMMKRKLKNWSEQPPKDGPA